MSSLSNLLSVEHYAALRGTQNQAVYKRISKGSIKPVMIGRITFIDKVRYPPDSRIAPVQPANQIDTVYYGQAEGVTIKSLQNVRDYARQAKTEIYIIYEAIIAGKLKAIIIDGIAFIDTAKFPPASLSVRQLRRTKRG